MSFHLTLNPETNQVISVIIKHKQKENEKKKKEGKEEKV